MNTKEKYKDVFGDAHLQLGVPLEWINGSEKQGNNMKKVQSPSKKQANVITLFWKIKAMK